MTDQLANVADLAVERQQRKQSARPRRLAVRYADNLTAKLVRRYLVKGLVPRRSLLQIIGDPNSGKTAVAIDLACHIAASMDYREHRSCGGPVVYFAVEASESAENRVLAWCSEYAAARDELPFAMVSGFLDLREPKSVSEAVEVLREVEARFAAPIALIVIDTQSAAMPGGDENSSSDMTRMIGHVRRLRDEAGDASIALIHHTGKDSTRGARGHSTQLAAMDGVFEIRDREIVIRKARDGAVGEALAFDLRAVEIGQDEDGEPVTAVVAVAAAAAAGGKGPQRKLSDGAKLALQVLRALLKAEGVGVAGLDAPAGTLAVSIDRWREKHRLRYGKVADAESAAAERMSWKRALSQLQAARIVTVQGDWVYAMDRKPHD